MIRGLKNVHCTQHKVPIRNFALGMIGTAHVVDAHSQSFLCYNEPIEMGVTHRHVLTPSMFILLIVMCKKDWYFPIIATNGWDPDSIVIQL